jgi:hypothetical protein
MHPAAAAAAAADSAEDDGDAIEGAATLLKSLAQEHQQLVVSSGPTTVDLYDSEDDVPVTIVDSKDYQDLEHVRLQSSVGVHA